MTVRLAVFGGGNMGAALVGGLVASGWATPAELAGGGARRGPARGAGHGAAGRGRGRRRSTGTDRRRPAGGEAGRRRRRRPPSPVRGGARRVLSIAAGVSTGAIEAALGTDAAVVRAMPNTPALVRAGAAAIAPGRHAGADDLDWAAGILGAVGTVVRVPEHLLDAVTGLSGSGPAYLFLVVEALDRGRGAGRAASRRECRSSRPSSWWARPPSWPARGSRPSSSGRPSRRPGAPPPPASAPSSGPAPAPPSSMLSSRPPSAAASSAHSEQRPDFRFVIEVTLFSCLGFDLLSAASGVRVVRSDTAPRSVPPWRRFRGRWPSSGRLLGAGCRRARQGRAGRAGAVGGSAPALFVSSVYRHRW